MSLCFPSCHSPKREAESRECRDWIPAIPGRDHGLGKGTAKHSWPLAALSPASSSLLQVLPSTLPRPVAPGHPKPPRVSEPRVPGTGGAPAVPQCQTLPGGRCHTLHTAQLRDCPKPLGDPGRNSRWLQCNTSTATQGLHQPGRKDRPHTQAPHLPSLCPSTLSHRSGRTSRRSPCRSCDTPTPSSNGVSAVGPNSPGDP